MLQTDDALKKLLQKRRLAALELAIDRRIQAGGLTLLGLICRYDALDAEKRLTEIREMHVERPFDRLNLLERPNHPGAPKPGPSCLVPAPFASITLISLGSQWWMKSRQ